MARFKTANAQVIASGPQVGDHWEVLRRAAFSPAPNFRQKTAKVILQEYEPKDFLLSHCTIIASVDTEEVAGQSLGRSMVDGFQIDREIR